MSSLGKVWTCSGSRVWTYENCIWSIVRNGRRSGWKWNNICGSCSTRPWNNADVKTEFLYGDLIEEMYMDQPEGFRSLSQSTDVCRLQKSLYDLKQASRPWNEKFNGFLFKFGFIRGNAESCENFYENDNGVFILGIWVADDLLCGTRKQIPKEVINYLRGQLEITSEAANHSIGLKIARNRSTQTITLSQEQYVLRLLDRFEITNCYLKIVPADPFTDLMAIDLQSEGSQEFDQSIYREAVGSIMYLMVCTRPYTAFAVCRSL